MSPSSLCPLHPSANHMNDLLVHASHLLGPTSGTVVWRFPSKLSIDITNRSTCEVVLKPVCFRYGLGLKIAPNVNPLGNPADNRFPFWFRGPKGIHTLDGVFLAPGDSANTYAGIDPGLSSTDVQRAINERTAGELHLTCYWIDDNPRVQKRVVTL
jgi:hypothetical protein